MAQKKRVYKWFEEETGRGRGKGVKAREGHVREDRRWSGYSTIQRW